MPGVYDEEKQRGGTSDGDDHGLDADLQKLENYANEQGRYDREFNDLAKHAQDSEQKDSDNAAEDSSSLEEEEQEGDSPAQPNASNSNTIAENKNDESGADNAEPGKKKGIAGWSRRKKIGMGLAAIFTGGGATGFGVLLLLSPIAKVETLINSVDSYFGAANMAALDGATENALNGYIVKKIIPGLGKGNCNTTLDVSCTALSSDATNPIGKMYQAWRENHLERKLAQNQGLVFGRKGGTVFMSYKGKDIDLKNGDTIWDSADTSKASKAEVRAAIRDSFRNESLYNRYYTRYKVGKLVEQKYGVKRCIFACDERDRYDSSKSSLKKAGYAILIRRVIQPFSENSAVALLCVMDGNCNFDPDNQHDITDDNQVERRSEFSTKIQEQVNRLALQYGADKLEDLAKQVDMMGNDGVTKYAFRAVLSKVLGKEISGEAIDKVVTPIAWLNFAAQVITFINDVGPKLQKLSFALSSTMAVQTYMAYATTAHEARAGHTDMTAFGSMAETLTAASIDDHGNSSDMTQTPMYQEVINRGTGMGTAAYNIPSLLNPTAYAAQSKPAYTCNDGNPLPAGEKLCPEEILNAGNSYATAVSDGAKSVPGWEFLYAMAKAWVSTIGKAFSFLGDIIGSAIENLPFVKDLINAISNWLTPFLSWVAGKVLPNMLGSLTGGRLVDAIMAGGDVTYNTSANTQLGGAHASDQEIANVRTAYLEQQRIEFQSKSLYARLFDTSSPRSMVTQVAATMPTKKTVVSTIGSMLRNPLGHLNASIFGALRPTPAFAAVSAQPDPWNMPQVAILPSQIPSDIDDTWWPKHCPDDYVQKFLDSQKEDPATGMMIADKPEPCMLYKTVSQVAGSKYDPSLLPQDTSSTAGGTSAGAGGTGLPAGDTITLAKQIWAQVNDPNGNIKFQNSEKKAYFQHIVETGHATQCGAPLISPKLLGVILTLSQQYKLVLGVFDDGHNGPSGTDCDNGFHPRGYAVDINGVNPINGGPGGTGTQLHFDAGMPLVRQFYQSAGEILAANGGGGLGQYGTYKGRQCFAGQLPPKVAGVTYFADSCDHLHLDTRGK